MLTGDTLMFKEGPLMFKGDTLMLIVEFEFRKFVGSK